MTPGFFRYIEPWDYQSELFKEGLVSFLDTPGICQANEFSNPYLVHLNKENKFLFRYLFLVHSILSTYLNDLITTSNQEVYSNNYPYFQLNEYRVPFVSCLVYFYVLFSYMHTGDPISKILKSLKEGVDFPPIFFNLFSIYDDGIGEFEINKIYFNLQSSVYMLKTKHYFDYFKIVYPQITLEINQSIKDIYSCNLSTPIHEISSGDNEFVFLMMNLILRYHLMNSNYLVGAYHL